MAHAAIPHDLSSTPRAPANAVSAAPSQTAHARTERMAVCFVSGLVLALAGCSTVSLDQPPAPGTDARAQTRELQRDFPDALRVPETARLALRAVAVGRATYECRADPAKPEIMRWVPVAISATMKDGPGQRVGQMSGPPVVWSADDGSRVQARDTVAEAPRPDGLPWQLIQVQGSGTSDRRLAGVDSVQQVATRGGHPRASQCDASEAGRRDERSFQADYVFWRSSTGGGRTVR